MNCLVYTHTRPDTNEVFYVGKGTVRRVNERRGRNNYWNNVVNKAGGFVSSIVAGNLDSQTALNFEKVLIKKLREEGFKLCNITDGGEGVDGYKHSPERLQKVRQAALGNKSRTGQKISDQQKAKMSAVLTGRKHSEETKRSIGTAVYCLTNNTVYDTQTIAAKQLEIPSSSVSMCCRGLIKQTHGYQFQYASNAKVRKEYTRKEKLC
jgi:hypothetical protein